jgi:hypothetical protein
VWRFLQVHSAQDDVNTLQTSVATLQVQIPTFSAVVRAHDELAVASGQITRLTSTFVDWPAVLTELDARMPAGLTVTSFTGNAQTTSSSASSSTATPGASSAGAVGNINVSATGSFPANAHFSPVAEWIDNITASSMFDPPSVNGVTNAQVTGTGGTTVSFSSTVSLKSTALVKKGSS